MCSSAAESMRSSPPPCSARKGATTLRARAQFHDRRLPAHRRSDGARISARRHGDDACSLSDFARLSGARQGPRSARLCHGRHEPADGRASAGRIERHPLDGSRPQREDLRRARRGRRERLRGRDGRAWRGRAVSLRSVGRLAMVIRNRQDARARALAPRPARLAEWFGEALAPARGYLEATYRSDAVRDLWAPWVLHTGLGPESAYSAAMVKVIAFAIEAAGCPIAGGGAKTLVAAFERLIVDQGGAARTNADVVRITPGRRRARGRRRACERGNNHGGEGRDLFDWTRATLQWAAEGLAPPGACGGSARPKGLSAWQGRHADPLRAEKPATLARRSGSRQGRAHPSHKRTGRRFARRERGRTRPPSGRAHDLCWPADGARSKSSAAGRGDPLAAAARGAALREGRRGRRDRSIRRWRLDGGDARSLTPTASSGGSPRRSRTGTTSGSRAGPTRQQISRR